MPNIMKAVKFMIDTANDNTHGYGQTHRNGDTRKQKLTAAGYDYSAIQKLVNQMLA